MKARRLLYVVVWHLRYHGLPVLPPLLPRRLQDWAFVRAAGSLTAKAQEGGASPG